MANSQNVRLLLSMRRGSRVDTTFPGIAYSRFTTTIATGTPGLCFST